MSKPTIYDIIGKTTPEAQALFATAFEATAGFSRGQLEYVAYHISVLNRVSLCSTYHYNNAVVRNVDHDVIALTREMVPVLRYAEILTVMLGNPAHALVEVRKQRWSESSITQLARLIAYTNMMNRLVLAAAP